VKLALVVHPDRDTAAELAADLTARAARRGIRVSAQPADAARVPGTSKRYGWAWPPICRSSVSTRATSGS
jgi:hypothetical protein